MKGEPLTDKEQKEVDDAIVNLVDDMFERLSGALRPDDPVEDYNDFVDRGNR